MGALLHLIKVLKIQGTCITATAGTRYIPYIDTIRYILGWITKDDCCYVPGLSHTIRFHSTLWVGSNPT